MYVFNLKKKKKMYQPVKNQVGSCVCALQLSSFTVGYSSIKDIKTQNNYTIMMDQNGTSKAIGTFENLTM